MRRGKTPHLTDRGWEACWPCTPQRAHAHNSLEWRGDGCDSTQHGGPALAMASAELLRPRRHYARRSPAPTSYLMAQSAQAVSGVGDYGASATSSHIAVLTLRLPEIASVRNAAAITPGASLHRGGAQVPLHTSASLGSATGRRPPPQSRQACATLCRSGDWCTAHTGQSEGEQR